MPIPKPLVTGAAAARRRWAALGLVVGPVAFVGGWAIGGRGLSGYSSVHDAISRIAAVGSPERTLMTAAFLIYGTALLVAAPTVRAATTLSWVWPALVVNALATWAVATLPLGASRSQDLLHGLAATVGYVSLAAVPALATRSLAVSGHRRWARASGVTAVLIAVLLALTTVTRAKGLTQRVGLGIGDIWLATTGIAVFLASATTPTPREAAR